MLTPGQDRRLIHDVDQRLFEEFHLCKSIGNCISIGVIADYLIGILTKKIAYKNQHLALLRREYSMTIPQIDLLIQHHSHSIYPVVINEHFHSIVRQVQ
ncbi:unnamed protein product [Rotaria sp. Silwood2]|nr:unnamed protein product [Rotaria sp. Silwood2]CAF4437333.1 unnamed protein product [Rotaria sp. Silwood2]